MKAKDKNTYENNCGSQTVTALTRQIIVKDLFSDGIALSPVMNMALDSWLATKMPLSENQAALRIYRWNPAGISVGRNQSWERALNRSALSPEECAVRRVTGGRAIYHDPDELTYSFVLRLPERNAGGSSGEPLEPQKEAAAAIVESLLTFLRVCGMDAKAERRVGYVPAHRADRRSPHCFVSTARHEITADGQKIVASAQRIHAGRFFQHGSIKFKGAVAHPALFSRAEQVRMEDSENAGNNSTPADCYAIGGEEVHRRSDRRARVARPQSEQNGQNDWRIDALRKAFEDTFGQDLALSPLNPAQEAEVFAVLADIDTIVGPLDAHGNSSLLTAPQRRTPHKQSPHSPRTVPHAGLAPSSCPVSSTAPHTEPHSEGGIASERHGRFVRSAVK